MIHAVAVELQARLRARGVPISVYDREGPKPATWTRERIVLEYDDKAGDDFSAVVSQSGNPKGRMVRAIAAKLTIYAQSTAAGAEEFEHRRRANHALDQVLVALSEIHQQRKAHGAFVPTGGGFVTPDDLAGAERYGGAVYELRFAVPRAITERTWDGDARPEATVGPDGVAIKGTTVVRIAGSDVEEIACGGA